MARCKNTDMLMSAIKKAGGGKVQTSADTARKLAGEMGGMCMGGKPVKRAAGGTGKLRKGEAPIKKKNGGRIEKASTGPSTTVAMDAQAQADRKAFEAEMERRNREAREQARREAAATNPDHKAKGGAAKVRKGMMSQSGKILNAVKPKKGIGGIM